MDVRPNGFYLMSVIYDAIGSLIVLCDSLWKIYLSFSIISVSGRPTFIDV